MSQLTLRVFFPNINKSNDTPEGYYDLDIDQNSSQIKATLSNIENQNLGKVFGLGTQAFTLPSTRTNDKFFGYSGDVGAVSQAFTFKKVFDAELLVDGARVSLGRLYYNGNNTNDQGALFYNVSYTDTIPSLADIFGEMRMADLPWFGAGYDHAFTWVNIRNSWNGTSAFPLDGTIRYPHIFTGYEDGDDYNYELSGNNSIFNNAQLTTDAFKPAVRLKNVIDLIFTGSLLSRDGETTRQNKYEVSSSFLDGGYTFGNSDGTSDDLYILPSGDGKKGPTDPVPQYVLLLPAATPASADDFGTANTSLFILTEQASFGQDPTSVLNTDTSDDGQWDGDAGGVSRFYAEAAGVHNFSLQINMSNITGNGSSTIDGFVYYRKDDSTDWVDPIPFSVPAGVSTYTLDGVSTSINLPENQAVRIFMRVNNQNFEWDATAKLEIINTNPYPDVVFMDYQWGDLKVIDFLKGLQQLFNLVFWTDYDEPNVIKIEPYNEWLDQGTERDWSDKVDYNKGISISHPSQEQPKSVTFKYAEGEGHDHDYVRQVNNGIQRGTYTFISDSDYNLGQEETIENPIFVPTTMIPLKGVSSNERARNMSIPIIRQREDGTDRPYQFKPRILFNNGKKLVKDANGNDRLYNIYDPIADTGYTENEYLQMSPLTSMEYIDDNGDAINFASLEFMPAASYYWDTDRITEYQHQATNDGLYNLFYARQFNNLYRNAARKVTMNLIFEPQDITEFRLNDLIFIDGQKYRINKISGFDFINPSSCEVEFIKELQPFNAPVFTVGSNGGPGTPANPGGSNDDDVVVGFGDEFTFEGAVAGNNFAVQPTYISGELSGSAVTGSYVLDYQATQLGITPGSGSQFYSKLFQPAPNITDPVIGGNTDSNDNVLPSDDAGTTVALGAKNRIGNNSTNTQVIGDDNTIGVSANDIFVVGDNNSISNNTVNSMVIGSDLEADGAMEDSVIIGGSVDIAEDVSLEDAVIMGTATQIESNFESGIIAGRSIQVTGSGFANAFANCNVLGGGNYDKDDLFSSANPAIGVNFIGPSRPADFDNPTDSSLYSAGNIMGRTFQFQALYHGYNNVTAIGTGAAYTVSSYEVVILVGGGGGAGTMTLPDADDYPGRIITIKSKVPASSGTCVISVSGGGNIDGSTSYTLNSTDYECIQVISDDSQWWIISKV